jgi:hypothetical protein
VLGGAGISGNNADSGFASVSTAAELLKRGLFFRGIVKRSSARYPKSFILGYDYANRGDTVFLQSSVDSKSPNMIAAGWSDTTVQCLIATIGSSTPGPPHVKKRTRWIAPGVSAPLETVVPRPRVFSNYYNSAQMIDRHNRFRQYNLGWYSFYVYCLTARVLLYCSLLLVVSSP